MPSLELNSMEMKSFSQLEAMIAQVNQATAMFLSDLAENRAVAPFTQVPRFRKDPETGKVVVEWDEPEAQPEE